MTDRAALIAFTPQAGDIIEFLSDRQTEKGPCSGHVVGIYGDTAILHISDEALSFNIPSLMVSDFAPYRNHPDRKRYWGLA